MASWAGLRLLPRGGGCSRLPQMRQHFLLAPSFVLLPLCAKTNAPLLSSHRATRPFCVSLCRQSHLAEPSDPTTAHLRVSRSPMRTHTCGELTAKSVGESVVLCGWSNGVRKFQSQLAFLPLRDAYGVVQLCFEGERFQHLVDMVRLETVCAVWGKVRRRPDDMVNKTLTAFVCELLLFQHHCIKTNNFRKKNMNTGEIEIVVEDFQILNTARNLPFSAGLKGELPNEDLRLKYRHIDLRRETMQSNLRKKSEIMRAARDVLYENKFVEVETPILFKSTPEGAREFLVPTRSLGKFYALPQSPQQCKQLLMAGGLDRYYQIARCFRDEDLRSDRQPEFTQEDIYSLIEAILKNTWQRVDNRVINTPFPRMQFQDAIALYGSDKPDVRYDLKIRSLQDVYTKDAAHQQDGEQVFEALHFPDGLFSHKEIKNFIAEFAGNDKWILIRGGKAEGPLRHLAEQTITHLSVNDPEYVANGWTVGSLRSKLITNGSTFLGRLRIAVANSMVDKKLLTIDPNQLAFLWVENFPLFSPCENQPHDSSSAGIRLESTHHPFTAPEPDDIELLQSSPEKIRGQHYDLVLNGVELGGGSIRIHDPVLQEHVFRKILKLNEEETSRFAHLVEALGHGCPPHGGIALGLDRLAAIVCKAQSLRDVIAFPKNSKGRDLTMESPSDVSDARLAEYFIQRADKS